MKQLTRNEIKIENMINKEAAERLQDWFGFKNLPLDFLFLAEERGQVSVCAVLIRERIMFFRIFNMFGPSRWALSVDEEIGISDLLERVKAKNLSQNFPQGVQFCPLGGYTVLSNASFT